MFMKEICLLVTVFLSVSCRSIENIRKPPVREFDQKPDRATEGEELFSYEEADSNTIGSSNSKKNDFKQNLMELYMMEHYSLEHHFDEFKQISEEKLDDTDVSFELLEFEKFRQSIFDIITILFKNKKPIKDKDRPIYPENEDIIINHRIKVRNYIYSTNISINNYINLMFDLEDYLLKPSNISKTLKHINIDTKLNNLGKKFLKNFVHDIDVNKFPLVFYDYIFPYLRRELLPIINIRKIAEKTSYLLGYEVKRPTLCKTLKKLQNKVEFLEQTFNLKNFLNTLNKMLNSSKVDNIVNKEIKLVYVDLLAELIGVMKFELIETAIPLRTFTAFFDALIHKSTTKASDSIDSLPKLQEEEDSNKATVLCPFGDETLQEVIKLTFYDFKHWFIGALDRFHNYLM